MPQHEIGNAGGVLSWWGLRDRPAGGRGGRGVAWPTCSLVNINSLSGASCELQPQPIRPCPAQALTSLGEGNRLAGARSLRPRRPAQRSWSRGASEPRRDRIRGKEVGQPLAQLPVASLTPKQPGRSIGPRQSAGRRGGAQEAEESTRGPGTCREISAGNFPRQLVRRSKLSPGWKDRKPLISLRQGSETRVRESSSPPEPHNCGRT